MKIKSPLVAAFLYKYIYIQVVYNTPLCYNNIDKEKSLKLGTGPHKSKHRK